MDASGQARAKVEFGDFQTPIGLARAVAAQVKAAGFLPESIVEPSCGIGNMLLAAADAFPGFTSAVGLEVQARYVGELRSRLQTRDDRERISIELGNFFEHDWQAVLSRLPDPILVIGNPPWVTNAALSSLGSQNLPVKTNFQRHSGFDALTGKSNFDISESMLLRIVRGLAGRDAMLAVLCKTAVARKVLAHAWGQDLPLGVPSIRRINSWHSFDASVDACVFECRFAAGANRSSCPVYSSLLAKTPLQTIAFREGRMLADTTAFDRWGHLEGNELNRWRSGIKHDCADVMEFVSSAAGFRTKTGEAVEIEDQFMFPMLKASDLSNGRVLAPKRWMLVTQRFIGDDTRRIESAAPRTWEYLARNAVRFNRRASIIYKGRPPFSIFGVGDYSFAQWKVGIAGLYKKLQFTVIGPHAGKPVVLDDTCYFVACEDREEAELIACVLNSPPARGFYSAFVFWDAKRPVTVELLRRLDLQRAAGAIGKGTEFARLVERRVAPPPPESTKMLWPE